MITEEKIIENKNRFLELMRSINREIDFETLERQLTESDFFTAPASTVYHCAYKGGLCEHCLNVYDNLVNIINMKCDSQDEIPSDDSIKIVALFHDFSKMNFYEQYVQNKKVYSDSGSKRDEMGRFDWVSVSAYKVKDVKNRLTFANHEMTSMYMAQTFIPMTIAECTAILHHMGGMSNDSAKDDITAIYSKYPLALYLHLADMLATYVDENE